MRACVRACVHVCVYPYDSTEVFVALSHRRTWEVRGGRYGNLGPPIDSSGRHAPGPRVCTGTADAAVGKVVSIDTLNMLLKLLKLETKVETQHGLIA